MNQVVAINKTLLSIVNISPDRGEMTPAGISRIAVRGFLLSISRSNQRLNAIAALLAKTIQRMTSNSVRQLNDAGEAAVARKKPTKANGRAKTVWLNFISDKYDFTIKLFISKEQMRWQSSFIFDKKEELWRNQSSLIFTTFSIPR